MSIDASFKLKGSGSDADLLYHESGLPSVGGFSPVVYIVCWEHSLWNSLAFFFSMSVVKDALIENSPA